MSLSMTTITVRILDELRRGGCPLPDVNWSEIVRGGQPDAFGRFVE